MTEKRARRKARQERKLNLPKRTQTISSFSKSSGTKEDMPPKPNETHDEPPVQRAQELVNKQRRSVEMLTLVRERIEQISAEEAHQELSNKGYFVVDNFLDREEIVKELEEEGIKLLDNGVPDMNNLAMGKYVAPIQGGEEQYLICPRSIEWVVSTTKHFGSTVVPDLDLDCEKCLGNMISFNRNALEAAKKLLVGDKDETTENIHANNNTPFACIVNRNDENDRRRLSLRYYLVDDDWSFGGNLEFENQGLVEAKRDRLVVWKSAETPFREEPWQGDTLHCFASCLDLDLI
jgi:hypothetical protein